MKQPVDQQAIILSMADCFTREEKALYCSSELTTGIRLYTACWDNDVIDRYALAEKLGKDWLATNIFKFCAVHAEARGTEVAVCGFFRKPVDGRGVTFWTH